MADQEPNHKLKLPLKVRFILATYTTAMTLYKLLGTNLRQKFFHLMDTKVPPSPTTPLKGVTSTDFTVDKSRNVYFRVYTPKPSSTTKLPTLIYIHGGGFVFFSADSKPVDDFCKRLVRQLPVIVISVNYRLAPVFKYPCQYDDVFDVLKFIDSADLFKPPSIMDLHNVFISGDSAGGNIAHHVAFRACQHEFNSIKLVGLALIMPFFGGEERTESEKKLTNVPFVNLKGTDWMWKSFLPEGSTRNHKAANVFGEEGENISALPFPNTAVFVGEFDPLKDWQRRYVEWLKRSGKNVVILEYPNAFHGCCMFEDLKESVKIMEDLREFVKKNTVVEIEASAADSAA